MAQLTFGGPLALLAAPFINRREQQRERETQDLVKRAYNLDQEALLTLAQKNPALLTALLKIQEQQREQEAVNQFNQTMQGTQVPGGMRLGNVPKLSMAPLGAGLDMQGLLTEIEHPLFFQDLGAGLDMQGLLTGASSAQPPVMPEIIQDAPYTRPPTDEEIRLAILKRLGATGNFSELSGVLSLSQAATEDFERQQKQETWQQIQDEIEKIRREGLSTQQLAESQNILNALGVNTGNITGGQLDLARIREIEQGKGETSDFTRKVAYLESIGKTPDEIVALVYKTATKDGSEKFTKDVQEFYEVTGKPPANQQEFLGYLKQREAATRKETPDKDEDLLKEYYDYNLKQMGGGSEFYHPTTGQLLMKSGGVLPKLTFEQFKQWRMTGEMPQPTGQTPAPSQPAQGTVKPRTAMDFLKSKGLMR